LVGQLSPEERARRMGDPNADYRAFYLSIPFDEDVELTLKL
jgi:hypothetical protein